MSNLFNYIYGQECRCNLLSGSTYGNRVIINSKHKRMHKFVNYDNEQVDDFLYYYKGDISNVWCKSLKYNNKSYNFTYKSDGGAIDICVINYNKKCDNKEYYFVVHVIKPSILHGSIDDKKWNVFMQYIINDKLIKIWLNTTNGFSTVNKHKAYI